MKKERIYLTGITLHTQKLHQTVSFSKVAQKGRMYSPLPKNYTKETTKTNTENNAGTFSIPFEFPADLKERIDRDEVEIMVPKEGLLIYAGKDMIDFINSTKGQRILRRLYKQKEEE